MTRVVPRPKKREPNVPRKILTHRLSINIGMLGTRYMFAHRLGTVRYLVEFTDVEFGSQFDIAFKQRHDTVEFQIPNSPDLIGAEWQIKVVTT